MNAAWTVVLWSASRSEVQINSNRRQYVFLATRPDLFFRHVELNSRLNVMTIDEVSFH